MLVTARIIIEAWLSLVERCVRDAEVVGSNPVASTPREENFCEKFSFFVDFSRGKEYNVRVCMKMQYFLCAIFYV